MKISTFAVISAAGMAATATAVWTTTDPAGQQVRAAPAEPATAPAAPALPDRSQFQAGNTLMMQGRLGHPVVPASTETENFLFVDVTAAAGQQAAEAPPAALAVVIDRSGSMKGKRLTNALAAARMAVRRLRDGDLVTVVTYDTVTQVGVPPQRVDAAARERIVARLAGIRPGGDTCISCGIETAMRLLDGTGSSVQRILLLSDGEPTAGVRDVPGFEQIAARCRAMGVAVATVGVDLDYNERVMAALARDSNGGHYFVADPAGLPAVFDQEAIALASTVAARAELTIDLAPGVVVDQVFDRRFTRRGNRVVVPMGAFVAADKKSLLMRLRVPAGQAGERPVAAVRLAYDDLVAGRAGTCDGELVARVSADQAELSPLDGLVSERVSRSETAAALEEANALFRSGDGDAAREVIAKRRSRLKEARTVAPTRAAPADRGRIDNAFAAQDQVLSGATSGFAEDPSPSAPAPKSQMKSNQADALELAQ